MTCRHIAELLIDFVANELTPEQAEAVKKTPRRLPALRGVSRVVPAHDSGVARAPLRPSAAGAGGSFDEGHERDSEGLSDEGPATLSIHRG